MLSADAASAGGRFSATGGGDNVSPGAALSQRRQSPKEAPKRTRDGDTRDIKREDILKEINASTKQLEEHDRAIVAAAAAEEAGPEGGPVRGEQ